MSSTGAFRISINGFNKSDVLNHIDAMQKAHMQEVQALQEKIEQLQKQCDVAVKVAQASKDQLAEANSRMAELEAENGRLQGLVEQHAAANVKLQNQLQEYEAMQAKIQEQQTVIEQAEQQVQQYEKQQEQLAELQQRISSLEEALEQAVSRADKASAQAAAAEEACRMLQQSKQQQNQLLDELGRLLGDIDKVYQQLKLS